MEPGIVTYRGTVVSLSLTTPNPPAGLVLAFALQRQRPLPPDTPPEKEQPVLYVRQMQDHALHSAGLAFVANGHGWLVDVDVLDNDSGFVQAVRRV